MEYPERRTYYKVPDFSETYTELDDRHKVDKPEEANAISSQDRDVKNIHYPVLDIDFPCRLVPSSTPGHFHLYLDGLGLSWHQYRQLLGALAAAGVIEREFERCSVKRGASFVRMPGVKKENKMNRELSPKPARPGRRWGL